MNLLILGGTVFVGRALVEAAQSAGHSVTLFNRGKSNPDLFPDVTHLRGDRDGGLDALADGTWDAVIDTSGYVPRHVRDSASLLADRVGQYLFISSISVYAMPVAAGADESTAVSTLNDPTVEEVTGETYGALKALCEQAAESAMPGRVLNVRAGLIVGPYDRTDRFTYWPVRVQRGGTMLAPPLSSPMQFIDVRDLAAWCITRVEAGDSGTFNVTGPQEPHSFGTLIDTCRSAVDTPAEVVEASEDFLTEHNVAPWSDLPLWLPAHLQGMSRIDVSKAVASGLRFRPLAETVADTLAWFASERGVDAELRAGLKPDREAEVVAAWQAR